ncbi:MAG: T9SS type A sorting domain-containing protein, partial [Bacteroidales bacterium]
PDVNADFQIWLNSSHIPWQTISGNLNIIRSGGKWGLSVDGSNTMSTIDATVGTTYLITAKVNFTPSNTTIALYVNPTIGTTPSNPTITATSISPLLFYSIGMYLNSNTSSVSIDEMRIGKTYSDVTPQGLITNINSLNKISLSVYPNPATDYITLQIGKNGEKADLNIIDMEGGVLISHKSLEDGSKISLANLNNGNYIVRIVSNFKTVVKQFIVKK